MAPPEAGYCFSPGAIGRGVGLVDFERAQHGIELRQVRSKGACGLLVKALRHGAQGLGVAAGEFFQLLASQLPIRGQAGVGHRQDRGYVVPAISGQSLVGVDQLQVVDRGNPLADFC